MKKSLILIALLITLGAQAQDVLKLEEGALPAEGSLADLGWLTGYWKGTGLGGDCDELWLPAVDNVITGIFRFHKQGRVNFTEYMMIEEIDGRLTLRLKHFNRDLSPWEDKEKWVEFKFIKSEGQTAWFHGLTYSRVGDQLTIKLSLKSKDKSWTEEFKFQKAEL